MQVANSQTCTLCIVKVNTEQTVCIQATACDHHRDNGGHFYQRFISQFARQDNDPVNLALLQHEKPVLFLSLVPMPADKQRHVIGFVQFVLNAAQGFAVVWTVNELGQHTNAHGSPASQTSGSWIGPETQLFDHGLHQSLLFLAHLGCAVQDARDGTGRHAGLLGHHAQSGAYRSWFNSLGLVD